MNLTKRDFLRMTGGAALAGAAVPCLAAKGAPYGGRKVRIAAIGTGGQASADLHAFLLHGIPLTDRDAAVRLRIKVHGQAPRRADLILPPVALADGTAFIEFAVIVFAQFVIDLFRTLVKLLA